MFVENLSKYCFWAFGNNIMPDKIDKKRNEAVQRNEEWNGCGLLFIVRMTYICYWHMTEDLKINESLSLHTRSSKKKGWFEDKQLYLWDKFYFVMVYNRTYHMIHVAGFGSLIFYCGFVSLYASKTLPYSFVVMSSSGLVSEE